MARAERLGRQIHALEAEYVALLRKALTDCAAGRWGLFGQNEHLRSASNPPELDDLRHLAGTIDQLRARAGEGQFPLHRDFEAARGRGDANALGEPKQAEAWLRRLAEI